MRISLVLIVFCCLSACGGGSKAPPAAQPGSFMSLAVTVAATSDAAIAGTRAGATPFIAFVQLQGASLASVQSISYTIIRRRGSVSKPVHVNYTIEALTRRGDVQAGQIALPVFGLYAGYQNDIGIQLVFNDASTQDLWSRINTNAYTDPTGIYDSPTLVKARKPGETLGFDFFVMKSGLGTPVIVDTDGAIRWVGVGIDSSSSTALVDNGFVIGDPISTSVHRVELDGSVATTALASVDFTTFHHNIDSGKNGLLANMNSTTNTESTIDEFTVASGFGKEWDFAKILSDYMVSQGDDPSTFVRPGVDWFHSNAATYDPSDNSIIVSSRENFLIKVDYESGAIVWIFGDPTKYWYSFPSLRAKALLLTQPGAYPIGQHAPSITSDGLVMIFNDGFQSLNQPAGAPAGASRSYSTVSAYSIDASAHAATEAWRFDYDQSIFSAVCGSAYEAAGKSLLVDYPWTDGGKQTRLVGLDAQRRVVFDFQYVNAGGCTTSWNAVPIHLEAMQIQ